MDMPSALPENMLSAVGNIKERLLWLVSSLTVAQIVVLLLAFPWFFSVLFQRRKVLPKAPVLGYRSIFEPTFLLQTRFITNAKDIVANAYKQMKDKPFVLRRYDVDFMVLPIKCLDEIRLFPVQKLSSRGAQIGVSGSLDSQDFRFTHLSDKNLNPKWTSIDFLHHSNLHIDVLKKKMQPELYKYVDMAKEEMEYGWNIELPQTDDWTEVCMEKVLRTLVARMTAAVFLGSPTCRDPQWLKISIEFSVDLFTTAFTMKMFPPWMYPIVAYLIPARYRVMRQLKTGRQIVSQLTQKHNEAKMKRSHGGEVYEQDTLLNWMLDHGSPSEIAVPEMGARQCVLTLASIHTTAQNVCNMLYDLCAHPRWFPVLREEIDGISEHFGTPGAVDISSKEWCTRLDKLDSFFVESQRHSPVLLLNPQRLAYESITLKDGTHIPAGTRLAFAAKDYQMDPAVYPDPFVFDPMRNYRKREKSSRPGERELLRAGVTNPENLAFGYGNQACAGRHFAVAEIKLVMARLLYEFEFKFPDGKGRPKNMYINENIFTDQDATIMMRKRRF
ncbi:Ent-kaurene oxidase [Madurella mycetomatis]|uniref:Ent-kaurene oxidase n=1 Tax=Madurella mycetomatis TaxID=100816 RepID=A0A175VQU6_9PEZI|nr:Ent-kaurene oxidase [Madurella mycetomatis]